MSPRKKHYLIASKKFHGIFYNEASGFWEVVVKLDDGETADGGQSIDEIEAAHMADECLLDSKPGVIYPKELNFPEED